MSTKVVEIKTLKVGKYIVLGGEACKIISYTTSSPGKHGAAKARILIVTGNLDIGGGYVDDVKFVEGEVAARGNLNDKKKPAKMPEINEIIEKIPVVEDGYETSRCPFINTGR